VFSVEHIGYVDSFFAFLGALEHLLAAHYHDGVTWSSTGGDAPKSLQFSKRGLVSSADQLGTPSITTEKDRVICARQVRCFA